jgi:azurin
VTKRVTSNEGNLLSSPMKRKHTSGKPSLRHFRRNRTINFKKKNTDQECKILTTMLSQCGKTAKTFMGLNKGLPNAAPLT